MMFEFLYGRVREIKQTTYTNDVRKYSKSAHVRLPVGSDVFQQTMQEMAVTDNTPTEPTETSDQCCNNVDTAVVIPETVTKINRPVTTERCYITNNPNMYLSCKRYPWICRSLHCVHKHGRLECNLHYIIDKVAVANANTYNHKRRKKRE
ncbi:hypothetical protein ACF0H5_013986 [Mactra antiquata]